MAICSGVNIVRPRAAMVIGIVGGFSMLFTQWTVLAVKVDDPLDATAGVVFH